MNCLANKTALALALTASLFAFSACTTVPTATKSETPSVATSPEKKTVPSSTNDNPALATGTFEGRNDHIVTGNVSIVEANGKWVIQLADNFSLDNAPDPKVGLGSNGYDPSTKAGNLIALTGASSYELPASVNAQDYNEVYIWCEKFDVPLGIAKLQVQ